MDFGKLYFYTASIFEWKHLLKENLFKEVIVSSLNHLQKTNKLRVYGFVIMPNHIHIIWELISMNGKELPHASFMKFTAHEFQRLLKTNNSEYLEEFKVFRSSREYQFWQRDSLPVELYSKEVMMQKLRYIHNNPVQSHWKLVENAEDYYYSSAKYYAKGSDDFRFLSHIGEWF
jgi:putative transposase